MSLGCGPNLTNLVKPPGPPQNAQNGMNTGNFFPEYLASLPSTPAILNTDDKITTRQGSKTSVLGSFVCRETRKFGPL